MTTQQANDNLRAKFRELIIKMNVQHNEQKIMAKVEDYLAEAADNSAYDQVANINTLVKWIDAGRVQDALGAIQHKDTLCHINRLP